MLTVLPVWAIIAMNAYVDPLWYRGGNKFSGLNPSYQERIAKLNLFLKSAGSYDCIIFGGSTMATLNATLIKGHRCFNFSFAMGNIREFTLYAKYIKALGLSPSLIIVAVDRFAFTKQAVSTSDVLEEVVELKAPPSMVETYLSLNMLKFSWDRITLPMKGDRYYYDKDFKGVMSVATPFKPTQSIIDLWPNDPRELFPVSAENLEYVKELRSVFKSAEFVGVAPYRSAWVSAKMKLSGVLEPTLRLIYQSGKVFDRFYDFTAPSEVSMLTDDTYDGFHYGMKTKIHEIEEINGDSRNNALHVHEETFEEYDSEYNRRVDAFIRRYNITRASVRCVIRCE
jgi:hypothetical protein